MREFLSAHAVPFVDRNIRRSEIAREQLLDRSGELVVPQVFWRDRRIVGFDPSALAELVQAYRERLP